MALGGDYDDDGDIDIRETWAGRQLYRYVNRTYREVAFFLDPTELVGPRASGLPLLSTAGNLVRWSSNSLDELTDSVFGEDDKPDRTPVGYYTWKFIPGFVSIVQMMEIYEQDKRSKH